MCLRDMGPMEILLDHPDKKLGEMLLPLLSRLRGERSTRIFFKMSEHPSEKVRRKAVKVLLARDPQVAIKLFPFLDDPNAGIRKDLLAVIAKQKSPVLENMLLKYLQENVDNKDTKHILACYKTLGCCGSDKAIPFLRRVLLDKGWNRFIGLGKPLHREGAAIALNLLDSQQTKSILLKASKSRFRVIRDGYHRAMTKSDSSGEGTNG
jgi:HEAT repeat protein